MTYHTQLDENRQFIWQELGYLALCNKVTEDGSYIVDGLAKEREKYLEQGFEKVSFRAAHPSSGPSRSPDDDVCYDGKTVFAVRGYRLETDKEMDTRISLEQDHIDRSKKSAISQIESLSCWLSEEEYISAFRGRRVSDLFKTQMKTRITGKEK